MLAFFRRQNGRAFFPPLPIAALLPRSWRWADSNGGAWDASVRLGRLRGVKKQAFFSAFGAIHTLITPFGMLRCSLDIFATQKASVGSNPRWLFYASRRACRPTAVFPIQLTRSRTRPASREACCRAAVKTRQAACRPTPLRAVRAVRGQGVLPLVRAARPVAERR